MSDDELYGPRTAFSRIIHKMKYRGPEETFDDYCVRYARTTADDEPHFRRLLHYLRGQHILPAGRQQLSVGRPYLTTAFNCLSGDTEVLTIDGYTKLIDLVDKTVQVLSPISGDFVSAIGHKYGMQKLYNIEFSNGKWGANREGSFTIRATKNHRWILQTEEETDAIKVGDLIKAGHSLIESDVDGWIHGFIYGDGSKVRDEVEGLPRSNPSYIDDYPKKKFRVRLCGNKANYLSNFFSGDVSARVTYPPSTKGDPLVTVFTKRELKELPNNEDPSYLRGFIEGLLAADGCFASRGNDSYQLHGSKVTVIWMRDHLILADYAPCGRAHISSDRPTNYGDRSESLWCQRFRRSDDHKGYRVISITDTNIEEEVYCLDVPEGHQFVLRNGIRTGNCFVGPTIADDTGDIFDAVKLGALTMRSGGGDGWDFSTIRPQGEPIRGLGHGAFASGPVSFMGVWDAMCRTIMSAGERRGAMMGVLRCDHPDILRFVNAKKDQTSLTNFNISVAITDSFMEALSSDGLFDMKYGDTSFGSARAADIWSVIMENNWDYAEPGVLFIDRINRLNPLWYCERIAATNPCFTGDTYVWTSEGHKTFKDLASAGKDIQVLTVNESGRFVYRTMRKPRLTQRAATLVEVTLVRPNGKRKAIQETIRCTPTHEFYTRDGRRVPAVKLVAGDRIYSVYRGRRGKNYVGLQNHLISMMEHHVPFENVEGLGVTVDSHHLDEDKTNNRPSNLELREHGDHSRIHKLGDNNPMRKHPEKNHFRYRNNIGENNGMFGKQHTIETLEKIGKKTSERFQDPTFRQKHSEAVKSSMAKMPPEVRARNHIVKSVRLLNIVEDVYCGTVDETNCFFIATGEHDGVLVHNCGEQPLPPHGCCLLGSINLPKFLVPTHSNDGPKLAVVSGRQNVSYSLDLEAIDDAVDALVRACDNVIDRTIYPLPEHRAEEMAKRRMGIGVTGVANAFEIVGHPYASSEYLTKQDEILERILLRSYRTSIEMASVKGPFPLFDADRYTEGEFISRMPEDVLRGIRQIGIRNGLLTSIAPTGTISLAADNVSSGIEPVFQLHGERDVFTPNGKETFEVEDYAKTFYGVSGRTANSVSAAEHVDVLCRAQRFVDSSISKTCNVAGQVGGRGPGVTFSEFKQLYLAAWEGGAKSCTTFNVNGKRAGIMRQTEGDACVYDPETGIRSCEA
jgi:ribonucleotide reductase alpha subunit